MKANSVSVLVLLLIVLHGLISIPVRADPSPLDGLTVSLPAGSIVGPDPDPWLDQGWLLNLSSYCSIFEVKIQQTVPFFIRLVHLIIALNDAAYNNLDYLYLHPAIGLNISIPKSSFQYGVPSPYGLMSWHDDVYPTWFNDTLVCDLLFEREEFEEPYHNMTVYVGFSNSTCARMHFDAYGTTQCRQITNPESVFGNPSCKDSTVIFFPPEKCVVTFLTDPVCSNFNITFQGSTYHNGTIAAFPYGTSGLAYANCSSGYAFDRWEAAGNVIVSNSTANPTNVTVKCGGTLRAVCKLVRCQVTFLTDPVCSNFNITFQGSTYHNGTTGTFNYGTYGPALANCGMGYVFDRWEAAGNVIVSNSTANPTNVTVKCGGTLKAVCKPVQCKVTFLTDPVCSLFNITFMSVTYHNGTSSTFSYGTSGQATANCDVGWVFDHWEVSGNVAVSSTTTNPTCVTINCGGTLKAVYRRVECVVTFLTDPVCSNFNITFQGSTYHNGDTGTFYYGTFGPASANCGTGYVFDHWEATGNVQVSNVTANPANVTVKCGGTLKAVCKLMQCQVMFFTDPVCSLFNITFDGSVYRNGTIGTFRNGTIGLALAGCGVEYVFDHWEVTGNVLVSNATANPTNVTIKCGGTLKAVFRHALCLVTFLTDPVCSNFNITFQGSTYHNGSTNTFVYGTSGFAFANCSGGYAFHYWEWNPNVQVSSTSTNPTNVTVKGGGTLKAVFKRTCVVDYTTQQHSPFVTFNASSSYDPDGYIVSYTWDFGDGNVTTLTDPFVAHNYHEAGTYNVTLTVVDNDGASYSATKSLTVIMLAADLNNDGIVNIIDVAKVAKAFGSRSGDPEWDETVDLNNDGIVNIIDVAKVAREFGKSA